MFNYKDWLIHQEHYKDLLREAAQARLAQLVLSIVIAIMHLFTPMAVRGTGQSVQ